MFIQKSKSIWYVKKGPEPFLVTHAAECKPYSLDINPSQIQVKNKQLLLKVISAFNMTRLIIFYFILFYCLEFWDWMCQRTHNIEASMALRVRSAQTHANCPAWIRGKVKSLFQWLYHLSTNNLYYIATGKPLTLCVCIRKWQSHTLETDTYMSCVEHISSMFLKFSFTLKNKPQTIMLSSSIYLTRPCGIYWENAHLYKFLFVEF